MVSPTLRVVRPVMMALVAISLISGVVGGLLRAGVPMPALMQLDWPKQALGLHAALMVCGFLGTVIGIERAVALRSPWAFIAPVASALGAACLLHRQYTWGAQLFELAAVVFAVVNAVIVKRQSAPHTWMLLLSAGVWLWGNSRFMFIGVVPSVLTAWFGFLVLTIAAERLEMSRLTKGHPKAQPWLAAVVAVMLGGVWWSTEQTPWGGVLFGASLVGLALWLGLFDIARRTVRTQGLSRYMAVCLLSGYAWLAVAGVCWAGYAVGWPTRDAALHALGLGFVFSMVMGHAPVILPAVARIKLHYDARFYGPLLALHVSLLLRLLPGWASDTWRAWGAGLNAASMVLFVVTVISAAVAWERRHPARGQRPRASVQGRR